MDPPERPLLPEPDPEPDPEVAESGPSPVMPVDRGRIAPLIRLRWTLREASGSLGDLGTFLPISLGLAVVCGLRFDAILLFAGLMNVVSGLLFRQPLAVQPMKAIAAIAIAEGLAPGAVAAGGLVTACIVMMLALGNGLDRLLRHVPVAVIRGLQVGVGLRLAASSLPGPHAEGGTALLTLGWLVLLSAVLCFRKTRRLPVVLVVFTAGLVMAWLDTSPAWSWGWPAVWTWPSWGEWAQGVALLAPAQAPLTLLNSVAAVCLLSADLFPGRGAAPKRVALSVGWMNVLCLPAGAMPMCHGAGGLAGQHACGARTGASVVMLGAAKIALAVALGGSALTLLEAYPRPILSALLVVAGATLAWHGAKPYLRRPRIDSAWPVWLGVALLVCVGHTLAGVLVFALAARPTRPEPGR